VKSVEDVSRVHRFQKTQARRRGIERAVEQDRRLGVRAADRRDHAPVEEVQVGRLCLRSRPPRDELLVRLLEAELPLAMRLGSAAGQASGSSRMKSSPAPAAAGQ
jgi:hypothetical protein